jgi:hypothetical protein
VAADEAHGVKGGLVVRPAANLVDRHDARVLQLAGDLRLAHEARPQGWLAGPFGPQFLERHIAAEAGVAGQPDAADAAGGVQSRESVALAGVGHVGAGADQNMGLRRGRNPHQRLADGGIVQAGQRLPDRVAGDLGQAGPGVTTMFGQLAL